MSNVYHIPKRRHFLSAQMGEKGGPLDQTKAPPHAYEGSLVAVINWVAWRWIELPDEHPLFDAGRVLLNQIGAD